MANGTDLSLKRPARKKGLGGSLLLSIALHASVALLVVFGLPQEKKTLTVVSVPVTIVSDTIAQAAAPSETVSKDEKAGQDEAQTEAPAPSKAEPQPAPPPPAPKPEPKKPEPKPEPKKPEPKPEPKKPEPKPEPKKPEPKPEPKKPDPKPEPKKPDPKPEPKKPDPKPEPKKPEPKPDPKKPDTKPTKSDAPSSLDLNSLSKDLKHQGQASKGLDLNSLSKDLGKAKTPKADKGSSGPVLSPGLGKSSSGAAPVDTGPALSALKDRLERLWSPNCDVPGGNQVVARIQFTISSTGRVIRGPDWVNKKSDPVWEAAAARAVGAVKRAEQEHAYEDLPDALKNQSIMLNFDAREACRGH